MFTTVFLVLSTGFSLAALVVATLTWRRLERLHRTYHVELVRSFENKRMEQCEQLVDDASVRVEQLHGQVRRINARLAARDRRHPNEPTEPDDAPAPRSSPDHARQPGESDAEFKRRIRWMISQGHIKHG